MGYRGKLHEREEARRLRAEGWTVPDIATHLGVSKGSVSRWVRDIEVTIERRKTRAWRDGPNTLKQRRIDEIALLEDEGRQRIGHMSEREFLMAGVALYAGEGSKTDGKVSFPNSDPRMIAFFVAWLRHFFEIDETRLRVRLYLHQGLDLDVANGFWSTVTSIPPTQFHEAYRAEPNASIRHSKHPLGCATVSYSCSRTHRAIMGLVSALLSLPVFPG